MTWLRASIGPERSLHEINFQIGLTMKSKSYVSLARNYSIVVVIAILVGVDKSYDYLQANRLLAQARRNFASDLLATTAMTMGTPQCSEGNLPVHGAPADKLRYISNKRSDYAMGHLAPQSKSPPSMSPGDFWDEAMRNHTNLVNAGWSREQPGEEFYRFSKYFTNIGQVWIEKPALVSVRANGNGQHPRWQVNVERIETAPEEYEHRLKHLKTIFNDVWHKPPASNSASEIYSDIEYRIFENKSAEVPGLGLQCSLKLVPWAFALLVMGLLVQIQNQLRAIRNDPTHGIEEPWLLLDGKAGLERFFALFWLHLVALSTLISNLSLGVLLWSEQHADAVTIFSLHPVKLADFVTFISFRLI